MTKGAFATRALVVPGVSRIDHGDYVCTTACGEAPNSSCIFAVCARLLRARTASEMRILQICSARTLGGGERHLADLANGLARRGHEVYPALVPNSALQNELAELP